MVWSCLLTFEKQERKTKRIYKVNPNDWPSVVAYQFWVGTVDNIMDENKVFHADVDGEHETTKFASITVDDMYGSNRIDRIAPKTREDIWDPRYISPICNQAFHSAQGANKDTVRTSLRKALAQACTTPISGSVGEAVLDGMVALILSMDKQSTDFKVHKPITLTTYTSDYTIYTISILAETDAIPTHVLKIHKRMVVVESNLPDSPFKLPISEELFIEIFAKPRKGTVGNLVLETASVIISCAADLLGKDAFTTAAGPEHSFSATKNATSHLHFFGNNAFSIQFNTVNCNNRAPFKSVHNAMAFMAGWTIRELTALTSDFEVANTSLTSTFETSLLNGYLETSAKASLEKVKEKKREAGFEVTTGEFKNQDLLKHSFLGRQDVKKLLSGKGGKLFYTKVWMATPTMAIIGISPQDDATKQNVFIWTFGAKNRSSVPFAPAVKKESAPLEAAAPARSTDNPSRRGQFSRRFFESSAHVHKSTLPPELELELQDL